MNIFHFNRKEDTTYLEDIWMQMAECGVYMQGLLQSFGQVSSYMEKINICDMVGKKYSKMVAMAPPVPCIIWNTQELRIEQCKYRPCFLTQVNDGKIIREIKGDIFCIYLEPPSRETVLLQFVEIWQN